MTPQVEKLRSWVRRSIAGSRAGELTSEAEVIEKLTLERAVGFAVKTEQLGARYYSSLAERYAEDAELKELFLQLVKDETMHEQQFKALGATLDSAQELSNEDEEYLRSIAMAEIFAGGHEQLDRLAQQANRADALQRAFEMEKTTLLYYKEMREVLGKSTVLDAIIAEEKRHLVQVARYLVTGAKMRGLADEF